MVNTGHNGMHFIPIWEPTKEQLEECDKTVCALLTWYMMIYHRPLIVKLDTPPFQQKLEDLMLESYKRQPLWN